MSETDNEQTDKPKPRGCFRCLKLGCLGFIIFAVCLYTTVQLFCFNGKPLEISEETTFITEPLLSSGEFVDYFKAVENEVYPKEMKTDDNGYALIVQTLGITEHKDLPGRLTITGTPNSPATYNNNPERVRQIYEKLGLEYVPNFNPTAKIEEPKSFLQQLDKDGTLNLVKKYETFTDEHGFWTLQDFPQLETYIKDNAAGLDILATAVRKKAYCMPMVRQGEDLPLGEALIPVELDVQRIFARAVRCRALYRIGNGETDKAIDDILTLHYLARHIAEQGVIIVGIVGISIEQSAYSVGINSNPKYPATKEQLQRLLDEREKLLPLCPLAECMIRERLFCLGMMQDFPRGIIDSDNGLKRIPAIGDCRVYDYNEAMKVMNRYFEESKKAGFDSDAYVEKEKLRITGSLWKAAKRMLTSQSRGNFVGTLLTVLLVPATESAKNAWERTDSQRDLVRKGTEQLIKEMKQSDNPASEVLFETPVDYGKNIFYRSGAAKFVSETNNQPIKN